MQYKFYNAIIFFLLVLAACREQPLDSDLGTPQPPPIPTLVSPADLETGISRKPTLIWRNTERAYYYNLQVSNDSSFMVTTVNYTRLIDTTATLRQEDSLKTFTKYYWRVRARGAAEYGEWSAVHRFVTSAHLNMLPPEAVLVSPANGATNINVSMFLTWRKMERTDMFHLKISQDSNFISAVLDTQTTDTSVALRNLSFNKKYYWKVRGGNNYGLGNWSMSWSFSTVNEPIMTPSTPELLQPDKGLTNANVNQLFRWRKAVNAEEYQLQVSTDSTFSNLFINESGIVDTSKYVADLATSTMYYWRVRAKNTKGYSFWSAVWNIKTITTTSVIIFSTNSYTTSAIFDLALFNTQNSAYTRLTNIARVVSYPSWSANAKKVLFTGFSSKNWEIYVMDVETKAYTNLSNHLDEDANASFSPDDSLITFISSRGAIIVSNIYVMNSDGSGVRKITNTREEYNEYDPVFSRDGKNILFARSDDIAVNIYSINLITNTEVRITNLDNVIDRYPAVSFDGKKVAFSRSESGNAEDFKIFIMNTDGSNVEQLTFSGATSYLDIHPSWSPDGRYICFESNRDKNNLNEPGGEGDIYLVDVNTKLVTRLTKTPALERQPDWKPVP